MTEEAKNLVCEWLVIRGVDLYTFGWALAGGGGGGGLFFAPLRTQELLVGITKFKQRSIDLEIG